ncbi:di-trans,poly-cis-decaprenylcistransferase [Candidatus Woesearchaeota archaeon]|nr:di-trans,poly-cis-decaprenylcistransferase [Candidatus Woesearchaeota archaeon]
MFQKFLDLMRKRKEEGKRIPLHVGLTVNGTEMWCENNDKDLDIGYERSFKLLNEMIEQQIANNVRILTLYLLPQEMSKPDILLSYLTKFLAGVKNSKLIEENQVKISVVGKWYDLPSELIEEIKALIASTKDYDRFFLNLCLNYNGQEEIVDACKLIAKKVQGDKLDPESITAETVKDNIYTSYFMPPDLIIKTGLKKQLFGFLLWDSVRSEIRFANKLFPDYSKDDFVKDVKSF